MIINLEKLEKLREYGSMEGSESGQIWTALAEL